jgi:tetratricopeptide (TPR) repeat protein
MRFLFSTLLSLLSICLSAQTQWSVVMTQGTAGQTYDNFYSVESVSTYISDQVKKGYVPTEIVYGDNKWYVVTTYASIQTTVTWKWSPDFPSDWITSEWDKGKYITKITYGDGKWFVIMTTDKSFKTQSWGKRTSWEKMKQYIDEKWKENTRYNITDLAYGDGTWAVVLSVMETYEHQKYRASESFPGTWIQEQYNANYNITSVEHDGTQWAVVMTKQATQKGETAFNPESAFPTAKIKEQWDKGRRINSFLYINKPESSDKLFDKYVKDGKENLTKKYYYTAIDNFKKALEINKFDGGVWNDLAWAQYLTGSCSEALISVDRSLFIKETRYNNHTKASILVCQNKCGEAVRYFDEAIRLYKKEASSITESLYYADRAKAKKCMRDYKGAKEDLQEAIKIDPNDVTLKNSLIEVFELMNK